MNFRRPSVPDSFRLDRLGEVVHGPAPGEQAIAVRRLRTVRAHHFDRCPICLRPEPADLEHVPPSSVGGTVMTTTCKRCNNRFGSLVEDELDAWLDGALTHIRFASEGSGVQGRRRSSPLLHRRTADGQFVLIAGVGAPPEVVQMLQHGEFEIDMAFPDPRRYRIAALKHAYLAACLHLGRIPDSPTADRVRAELIAARDATDHRSVPTSSVAEELTLARSYRRHEAPAIALCEFRTPAKGWKVGILLAGSFLVCWPLPDIVADIPE